MAGRRTDFGGLAAGVLFLAVAALFLHSALSGLDVLPFAYEAPALVIGLAVVLLLRILLPTRRR